MPRGGPPSNVGFLVSNESSILSAGFVGCGAFSVNGVFIDASDIMHDLGFRKKLVKLVPSV
jgi:hypothetical protein